MKTVRFLDLAVSQTERAEYLAAIDRCLASGWILNGPELFDFEDELATYVGTKYALGVGSGTAALYVVLKALDIGPDDEVITSALAFPGTANSIVAVGATPIFVDVLSKDMLIDPAAVEAAVTEKTRAIMPIHFTGQVCDIDALKVISQKYGLHLIEDAAPAFGARYNNREAGSFGIAGCFSMNPMKVLAGIGEAGAVVTNDRRLYERMLDLRYHGIHDKDACLEPSLNNRLDTIQAIVLSHRLTSLQSRRERREEIAQRYNAELGSVVRVPWHPQHIEHAWCHYTIRCDRRDDLAQMLMNRQIETRVYHRKIMPSHPAYKHSIGDHPVAWQACNEILCLPMHHNLIDQDVERVIEAVKDFYHLGADGKPVLKYARG